jgi:hypothetical protein
MGKEMKIITHATEIYEDNAGSLHLFVFGINENIEYDAADLIYAHSYESPEQIAADVVDIERGETPENWDGNEIEQGQYSHIQRWNSDNNHDRYVRVLRGWVKHLSDSEDASDYSDLMCAKHLGYSAVEFLIELRRLRYTIPA